MMRSVYALLLSLLYLVRVGKCLRKAITCVETLEARLAEGRAALDAEAAAARAGVAQSVESVWARCDTGMGELAGQLATTVTEQLQPAMLQIASLEAGVAAQRVELGDVLRAEVTAVGQQLQSLSRSVETTVEQRLAGSALTLEVGTARI